MKYKNIAISGLIGTGKTTLSRHLSQALGWEQFNGGEFFRDWYKKNHIAVEEVNKIPEEMDRKMDGDLVELMKTSEKMIFETKMAGFWSHDIPGFFKVLCIAEFNEMARRVAKREGISIKVAKQINKERADGLKEKYHRLYGVEDYLDPKYFDLVVDTTTMSKQEVLDRVMEKLKS